MKFKCGIIGLPNVGKSTLFNMLTHSSVKSENFPFCTIQANKGLVSVIDNRLFQLSELLKITHVICGHIQLIDIAGLIQGASQGEGLGNSFLSDVSEVDILCHVVRCFDNPNIYHVHDEINPKKDIQVIHNELILSDIECCERIIFSLEKNKEYHHDNLKILNMLKKCLLCLNDGIMLYNMVLSLEEKNFIKNYNFLTYKPIIYIANIDDNSDHNHYLSEISDIATNDNIPYMAMCFLFKEKFKESKIYNKIPSLDMMFHKNFEKFSKYSNFIRLIYNALQLKTFFTINTQEVRAWIVASHTIAIQAANIIHSEFKKYFIRVQVLRYKDLLTFRSWQESKKFGKVKSEGRNYLIQDGDILNFLI